MTTFVTAVDLASILERDEDAAVKNIVQRTNALVDEAWVNPVSPAPQWVINIAWNVALRAGRNIEGVSSVTKSWDDVTVTKRWPGAEGEDQRDGVYLTDEERTELASNGQPAVNPITPARSIRMQIPGWSRPSCW